MTSPPSDLLDWRADVRKLTGLGAVDVGIVGDGAHQRTGGYHEGRDVLVSIGRFHAPATSHVGSSTEDYSARQLRDRKGLTDHASAADVGDDWPKGGRAAWLRFNNLLYAEMRDRPSSLPALRAINVSLDGQAKRRYDQLHRGDGLIASTDSVTTHTHLEFWRDTEGRRQPTLARITQLIQQSIEGDDDVALTAAQDGALVRINDLWGGNGKSPWQNKLDLTLAAILAAARSDDEAGIKAHIDQRVAELAAGQAATRDAILAALPKGDGPVSRADLEAALRAVFGSLDGATPGQ